VAHSYERFLFPEKFLSDILRKGAQGRYVERSENPSIIYRATVVAVDLEGGNLENPDASGGVTHLVNNQSFKIDARSGPKNPRNSVKARVLTNGLDQFVDDQSLRVFWPFFSDHVTMPVKPGEHVYVLFEDAEMKHGLWINKIPGHEGVNLVVGESQFKPTSGGKLSSLFGVKLNDPEDPDNTDKFASESQINELRLAKKFGVDGV
jgi:hypothetical protein